jgi:hypothetical protein
MAVKLLQERNDEACDSGSYATPFPECVEKRIFGAQGRNRIVYDAIELEPFFELLFPSVPINVPSA